jgi:Zn-dependent alcohol dehydrogenase
MLDSPGGATEVLVRIAAVGLCRTDYQARSNCES